MAVLNVLVYRPLRGVMAQRAETIDGDHQKAKGLEEEVSAKIARYEAQLQEAKHKGSMEKAEMRRAAEKEEAQILGDARNVAADKLQVIRNKVASEAEEARKALKGEAETLASQVASKVLGRAI